MPKASRLRENLALVGAAEKTGKLREYVLAKTAAGDDAKSQNSWGPSNRI